MQEKMTVEKSMKDFKLAYEAKGKLVEREREDFLFALGQQWSAEDTDTLKKAGFKPFTDNRIQPNLFLLTGLERQNRTDFKAFPEGEEDGMKAEIASALFKDAIKKSGFAFKSSEQFKDGITCGESHLELYLDYTDSLLNGKPKWRKFDGCSIYPDPASREYDFEDAAFVYKVTLDMGKEDLINLYPDKTKLIEAAKNGKLNFNSAGNSVEKRDYPMTGGTDANSGKTQDGFDLIERYYKKWVSKIFLGDKKTGEIRETEGRAKAEAFVSQYKAGIDSDQKAFEDAVAQKLSDHLATMPLDQQARPTAEHLAMIEQAGQLPPPPPQQDPERFLVIKRMVPEIWCFAQVPGIDEPLADERAWFYPKWKHYPFATYFARFSTAPLTGDDRHLLVQGLVHGVKGAQEKHNKAEMLMLRHLNSSANSGWLSEEDAWVDASKVKQFGTTPGINLEHKKGSPQPQRISPTILSQGHAQLSAESAESIKAQLGINADLLATQQGGADSGRAIALRQKQGLLMVQELFDNLSRTRQIAGRFLLSQMGEMYDTETAIKVLGEAFMVRNFPPVMLQDPADPSAEPKPMTDEYGQPMQYDKQMAELAISEVLSGNLEEYNVTVGEAVASDTQRMSASLELSDLARTYPGLIPPDILVRHSQLPESSKNEVINAMKAQAQAAAQAAAQRPAAVPGGQPNA